MPIIHIGVLTVILLSMVISGLFNLNADELIRWVNICVTLACSATELLIITTIVITLFTIYFYMR